MKSSKIQKIIIVKEQNSLPNRRILELINEEKKVTNSKKSRCDCKSKSMEQLCDVFEENKENIPPNLTFY